MITTLYRSSWIDGTFATPKTVVKYMIATEHATCGEMIAAWDASCAEGIKAVEEREYLVRWTIKGEYNHETKQQGSVTARVQGSKIIVLLATQLANRHTQDTIDRSAPPDPHLHTHHAISTLAFLPDPTHPDGMRHLDEKGIKAFAEEANAIFMGEYARRLEEMGMALDCKPWKKATRGFPLWEV